MPIQPHSLTVEPGGEDAIDDFLRVARRVSATIGAEFFGAIATHLAQQLAADCVYLGEFVGGQVERVRPLAAYLGGVPDSFEYPLAGSAAEQIVLGKPCFCRVGAKKRFPLDALLAKVGARAFCGVPLANSNRPPLGFMMAIFRRHSNQVDTAKLMLEIFAPRATAELTRKQKDEQLQESEQRYRAFIKRNTDGMWRVEFEQPIPTDLPEQEQLDRIYHHGYLAECNDAMAQLLGFRSAEQLIGCRIDVIAPRSNPSLQEATLRAIRSDYRFTTFETTPLDANGKQRYMVRTQWGIVDDGMLRRMWGTTRDVTELKESELALNASERRMADLLEAVHLAVVMLDPNGAILYCNDYLFRLTGWTSTDVLGQNWLDRMIPPDESVRLKASFEETIRGLQAPLHFESTLLGPGGRRFWIAWDSAILRHSNGEVAGVVNVGRDTTDHKALEMQFRQAQKLESIGRLASGVAHDFNNILTVIQGYCSALLHEPDSSHRAADLSEIQKAAQRGADLIQQLLAFSRQQQRRIEALNLNTLIAENERMLRRLIGENIKLTVKMDPLLRMVRTDAGQIHQVLLNLALNARDAMPSGGALTLTSSNVDVDAQSGSSLGLTAGRYVQLTVADTGSGMSEEARDHLFEPFFTTKAPGKGTGLGLATVYGIIRQSGGHILVETELNKGTSIRIFLPCFESETDSNDEGT